MIRKSIYTAVTILVAAGICFADTKTIKRDPGLIEIRMPVPEGINWDSVDISWESRQPLTLKYYTYENGSVLVLYSTTDVVLQSDVINWDARKREKTTWIVNVGKPPTPDPGPGPDPDPTPPDDAPFPTNGLAVLIIHEASETISLPAEQRSIFTSPTLINWINQSVVRLSDGKSAFRIWDDDYTDSQLSNVDGVLRTAYRDLLRDAGGRLPWIGISNGKTGYSGPLPATIEATKALIERYK